jgi:hypothetical protein
MISSGNEAVLSMADYLNALVDDAETAVIAVYVEGHSRRRRLRRGTRACPRGRQAGGHAEGRVERRHGPRCGCAHRRIRRRQPRMAGDPARTVGDSGALGTRARRCRDVPQQQRP